jgi:hypothetical protein
MFNNKIGNNNTSVGYQALHQNLASGNTAFGRLAMYGNSTGIRNTAIGGFALQDINRTSNATSDNTALGYEAGSINQGGSNTFIGSQADQFTASSSINNASAIGYNAKVSASNSIQLGNTSVTNVATAGTITAGDVTYPKLHGTANQVLSTTGSGTLTWVTPTASGFTHEVSDEFTATASQAGFTLSITPGANSKVKMYINGIRISNTAYSISGTSLTYDSTKNGNYTISVGDRIQFDFSY